MENFHTNKPNPEGNKYQKQRVSKDFKGISREYMPEHDDTSVIHTKMSQIEVLARLVVAASRKSTIEERVLSYMACFSVHGEYKTGNGNRKEMCKRLKISKSTYARAIDSLLKIGVIKKLSTGSATNQYVSYRLHYDLFSAREQEGRYSFNLTV